MIMGSNKLMAAMEGFVVCLVISMQVLGAAVAILQPPQLLFVFGDGNLDVGNNNFLSGPNVPKANRLYYGVDFLLGIPTGRFSNGYNTADYIANKTGVILGISPPAYLSLAWSSSLVATTARTTGMSYASGGAGILDSTNAGNTIPLRKQVQYFNATRSAMMDTPVVGSAPVDTLFSRSVVLIGIGGNDLASFANAPKRPPPQDVTAFLGSLMSNYSAAITDLYTLGARKFAIINVGLDGCLPAARVLDASGSCSDYRNYLANSFDNALESQLAGLAARLPGFRYSLADSFALMVKTFFDLLPAPSGFANVTSACCGGGRLGAEAACSPNSTVCADHDRHYFWDAVHITQQAAKQRADFFYDEGPGTYTTPINLKQLVNMTAA